MKLKVSTKHIALQLIFPLLQTNFKCWERAREQQKFLPDLQPYKFFFLCDIEVSHFVKKLAVRELEMSTILLAYFLFVVHKFNKIHMLQKCWREAKDFFQTYSPIVCNTEVSYVRQKYHTLLKAGRDLEISTIFIAYCSFVKYKFHIVKKQVKIQKFILDLQPYRYFPFVTPAFSQHVNFAKLVLYKGTISYKCSRNFEIPSCF